MADGSSIIVNVGDLDVAERVNISVDDILVTHAASGPTTLKHDEENALIAGVAEAWKTKAFADVEVICGVDGGTVLTHRIFLASLSSFLKKALRSDAIGGSCAHETTCLLLPDVDSVVLSNFLSKVCNGSKETAVTSPSLAHLGFHMKPFSSIKVKPEFDNIADLDDDDDDDMIQVEPTTGEFFGDPSDEGRKKSVAWKFFKKLDHVTAVCTLCSHIVKTGGGNTSGMGRHMKRTHPDVYASHNMTFQLGTKLSGGAREMKKRSIVWNYFIKQDNKSAMCTICNSVIRTESSNTSGMGRHLRRYHPEIPFECVIDEEDSTFDIGDEFEWPIQPEQSMEVNVEPILNTQTKHQIWNNFESRDGGESALCLRCGISVKTEGGNTSGMTRHLKRSHPETWQSADNSFTGIKQEVQDGDIFAYDDDGVKGRLRSLVWNYYRREDKTTAVCTMCDATVKTGMGNTSGMARHLRRSHPDEHQQFVEASRMFQPEEDVKPVKMKVKKPRVSQPSIRQVIIDPLRDVWQFFDDVCGAEAAATREGSDECSAICKFCQLQIVFSMEDTQPLTDHLKGDHQAQLDEASEVMIKAEEESFAEESVGSTHRRNHGRSAIWRFFKRTSDRLRNECLDCGKVMLCTSQNTTSMIRHLERRHHDLYLQFLQDSGSKEEVIKKAEERKLLRSIKVEVDPKDPSNRTCPVCFKVFWHKRAMLYHKKVVHSGERPYVCQVPDCNMSFARLDCFKKHSHNIEKKFLCSHCGKTFGRKSARDLHERAHRGDRRYSCIHCAKMFMTNQALQKHERIHTGEKPYQCKDCGKQFTQQHQLTTHVRIHTGEKPYSCDFCELKFRHLSSKSKHRCEGKMMAAKWMSNPVTVIMDPQATMRGHDSE